MDRTRLIRRKRSDDRLRIGAALGGLAIVALAASPALASMQGNGRGTGYARGSDHHAILVANRFGADPAEATELDALLEADEDAGGEVDESEAPEASDQADQSEAPDKSETPDKSEAPDASENDQGKQDEAGDDNDQGQDEAGDSGSHDGSGSGDEAGDGGSHDGGSHDGGSDD